MYPAVFKDYRKRYQIYGQVRTLAPHAFFHGILLGEHITADTDPDKRFEIQLQT